MTGRGRQRGRQSGESAEAVIGRPVVEKAGGSRMLTGWSAIAAILVMAVVTFALRALPFVAAGLLRRHRLIRALGRCSSADPMF